MRFPFPIAAVYDQLAQPLHELTQSQDRARQAGVICEGNELFAESTTNGMLEARNSGAARDLVNAARLSANGRN
jgi:hypothetical protein